MINVTRNELIFNESGAIGVAIINWQQEIEQKWGDLRFGELKLETDRGQHVFEVQVYLNGLDPALVQVELYANGINANRPERLTMLCARQLAGTAGGFAYRAKLPARRPAADYTARLIPHSESATVPLESGRILWQR